MANEAVLKYSSTTLTLTGSGALTNNNSLSTPAGTTYSQTNTLDYPDAVFVLITNGFSGNPAAGSTIDLYIRPLNIDGNTGQPAPNTGTGDAYKGVYIGSFVLKPSSASGEAYRCIGYDIPRSGEASLFNNATGVNLTAGWQLKMTPRTVGPL